MKMKFNITRLVIITCVVGVVSSCQSLLDIEDTDFIGGDIALLTVEDNENLLIGAYAALQNGTPPTPAPNTTTDYETNIRFNGILSDELKNSEFYSSQTMHEWTFSFDDVPLRDLFMPNVTFYRVIDRVNRILDALPTAIAETEADEAKRDLIRGEALFLRAFSHFELFRYFCKNYDPNGLGMPYMELPQYDPLEVYARINMDEYFSKIQRDIQEAKPLLANSLDDKNRVNRITASGFQARIALYTRNWPDAVTYSTEYINAIPLSPRGEFAGIWTDANTNEVSWRLRRSTANRIGTFFRGVSAVTGGVPTLSTVSWVPSDKLWNAYDEANDIRFEAYLVDEPRLSNADRYSRILKKYNGTGYGTNNENVADIKVFRTAEMYLIRAEARAELGTISGANSAESDLNALRAARIDNYTNISLASLNSALDEILNERFKELALEGHRFWDLKRRERPVERLESDAPAAGARTLPANNFRFVLPIPRWEMESNPLMVQNEGYTGG